ncbi:MAG: hypothetical protein WA996_22860 [Candidatus Promineifilaceae bacterium]
MTSRTGRSASITKDRRLVADTPLCHFERAFNPEQAEGEKSLKPVDADSISLG